MKEHECPKCKVVMNALLFMGVELEGYTCPKCQMFYMADDDGNPHIKPLAKVF